VTSGPNGHLLDVNVLIALLDPAHVNHDAAHQWYAAHSGKTWATCPITENGVIRILSSLRYPNLDWMPSDVIRHLRRFLRPELNHVFWPDGVSLTDGTLFQQGRIRGHKQITDIYLLGLAVHRGGTLVTFDRSIPLESVQGAGEEHLTVIG
jgi:toxin-antitoxin system PIN domain toxin